MKKMSAMVVAALSVALFTTAAVSGSVSSLRGDQDINAMSKEPGKTKVVTVKGGIKRNFEKQPPMVPHKVDKYKIDLRNNGCMKCHSEKTYEKEKAPKIGDSHYVTRDGKTQDTLSSRRYFCNQCHAPQMDAEPLVQNTFQGLK